MFITQFAQLVVIIGVSWLLRKKLQYKALSENIVF
jgi:transposase-like protein